MNTALINVRQGDFGIDDNVCDISVANAYEIKDELKARGYSFDSQSKEWALRDVQGFEACMDEITAIIALGAMVPAYPVYGVVLFDENGEERRVAEYIPESAKGDSWYPLGRN